MVTGFLEFPLQIQNKARWEWPGWQLLRKKLKVFRMPESERSRSSRIFVSDPFPVSFQAIHFTFWNLI